MSNSQTASTVSSWDGRIKALHWSIALAMLILVPAGYVMSATYGPSFKDAQVLKLHILASQVHHTLGVLVLFAALAWVARRVQRGRPPLEGDPSRGERILTASTHGALKLLLLVVPWSGWTALSALADSPAYGVTHRWFFGWDGVLPRIWAPLPFNDPLGYALFGRMHVWALWLGLALLMLHVGAALLHHFSRRDRVLRRMWPLAGD